MEHGKKDELWDDVEPVISGLGFSIVELKSRIVRNNFQVHLVIYHPEGVGVEDCSLVYKTLFPRIEILIENRDINLEVSSPGIERRLKSVEEFAVFKGKGIRILPVDSEEWITGIIEETDLEKVRIKKGNETVDIEYNAVRKAKLDYS